MKYTVTNLLSCKVASIYMSTSASSMTVIISYILLLACARDMTGQPKKSGNIIQVCSGITHHKMLNQELNAPSSDC